MKKDNAPVADELKAYLENLAEFWPEGDTNVIDKMATAIEMGIPPGTNDKFAIKARKHAQLAREFGISEKGVIHIVEAQCAFKDYMLLPDSITGEEHREVQREKARKLRGKITDDGETIGNIINRLAHERDALGDPVPAPNLWEPFFSALQDAGADPKETRNNGEPRKTFYSYTTAKGTSKEIKRGTFENKISADRKKLSR